MAEPMRLQRYLAAAGVSARRKAEALITEGRVKVNDVVVTTLGTKVDPDVDQVTVDGEAVVALDAFYVLLNKPKGCITAVTDDRGRPVVMDYLPNLPVPVKPVGRLDFYSEGVLLLTNDGELAARLLAPASHVPKTYHVKVHGQLSADDIKLLRDGVQLDDGSTTMPAEIAVLPGESKHTWLGITIHEGKHRQIHRMIEALGYRVDKLQRVAFANLTFHDLRIGDARELTQQELNALRDAVGLDHSAVARGRWHSKREGTDIPRRARAKARDEAEELREEAEARRGGRAGAHDEDGGATGAWDDELERESTALVGEVPRPRGREESSGSGQFGNARPRLVPERDREGASSKARSFGSGGGAAADGSRPRAPMSRQIPGPGDSRVPARGRGDRPSGPRGGARPSGPRDYRERMSGARGGSELGSGTRGGKERPSSAGGGGGRGGRSSAFRGGGTGAGERSFGPRGADRPAAPRSERPSGPRSGGGARLSGPRGSGGRGGERPSGPRSGGGRVFGARDGGERPSGPRSGGGRGGERSFSPGGGGPRGAGRSFGPGGGAGERKAGPRGGGATGRDRTAGERSKERWPRAEREAQRRAERPPGGPRDGGPRSAPTRPGGAKPFAPRGNGAGSARAFKPGASRGRSDMRSPRRDDGGGRSDGDGPPKRGGQGRSFGGAKPKPHAGGDRGPKRGRPR